MRILAHIHGFPPDHNAGAEWMAHDVLRWLQDRDHAVQVATRDSSVNIFHNIPITTFGNSYDLFQWYDWADVVITHLDETGRAINLSKHKRRPLVHLVHNTHGHSALRTRRPGQHVAFNSRYVQDTLADNYSHYPQTVLRPPTFEEDYFVEPEGEYITLIGLNENKGGNVLREIASNMPNYNFMGVKGGYGDQITDQPDNVTIIENTPDIKEIYRETKILLVPSDYESWGRVAVEAMCSGIPVIANPTPGLKESCDEAAIYADINDISQWVEAIKYVSKDWNFVSELSRNRFKQLDFKQDLIAFEKLLESASGKEYDYKG